MSDRRLLLICEYPTLHGGERSMLATLPTVQAAGFVVSALVPGHGPLADALAQAGCRVIPYSFAASDGVRRPLELLRAELAALFAQHALTLVHANSLSTARLTGPVCRRLKIPSIGHLRDIVHLKGQAIADLNGHSRLLAVSRATAQFHEAQGLDSNRLMTAYNGIDLGQFCPRPKTGWLHHELGLPVSAPLVGHIGQLVMRKGQDVLAAAAVDVLEAVPEAHFVFVGERFSRKDEALAYESRVRAAFDAPPLAGRGHFLDTRGDVSEILPELTVLAHAARQEPLGRVLLEAAASGVPIVATEVGGTREILGGDDSAAALVPADNAPALAAGVCRLILDPTHAGGCAVRARQRMKEQFDIRQAAAVLVRHYEEVVALGARAP